MFILKVKLNAIHSIRVISSEEMKYWLFLFLQCHRQYEKTVLRGRGIVRGSKGDYLRAFCSLVVFFVLIWGPWALFTFDHTVGKSNVPYEVSVSLQIGSSDPFYRMTAQATEIHQYVICF